MFEINSEWIEKPEEILMIVGAYADEFMKCRKTSSITGEVKDCFAFIFGFELHKDTIEGILYFRNTKVKVCNGKTFVEVC